MTASSTCCARSSRTTSPRRSRSAARPWSSATSCGFPPRPSATTWPRWRTRATSASRTPAPAGCPPTAVTGCSSTSCPGIKPLSPAERRAIERFLIGAVDLDDVVHRTVRLLAQVTGQVAVVQYPSLTRSSVRHLELVPISTTRLMLVMITDTGRVEQRIVELPDPIPPTEVSRAAHADQREARRPAARRHAAAGRRRWSTRSSRTLRADHDRAAAVLLETLIERADERIALAGTANLTRAGVLRLPRLDPADPRGARGRGRAAQADRLGRGGARSGSASATRTRSSTCAAPRSSRPGYGPGTTIVGGMGVLGPTRMDYPATITAVSAVARYVGELLAQN